MPPKLNEAKQEVDDAQKATVSAVLDLAHKTDPGSDAEVAPIRAVFNNKITADKHSAEQQKIKALRTAGVLQNWDGRGELGAVQATGNAEVVGFTAALTVNKRGFHWRHRMTGRAYNQQNRHVVSREQYQASCEPNLRISERVFTLGFGQYKKDHLEGFAGRYTRSAGCVVIWWMMAP